MAADEKDRKKRQKRSEPREKPAGEESKALLHAGECLHCRKTFAKNQMTRHVARCPERPGGRARVAHLIIESADWSDFYVHVECSPDDTLAAIDQLLRDTWLECCGHLSSFEIGDQRYEDAPDGFDDWGLDPAKPLSTRLTTALAPKGRFSYVYDFGSSTRLVGRWVGWVDGAKAAREPRIVARNHIPRVPCTRCRAPAKAICTFCNDGPLCGECLPAHAKDRDCGDDGLLPVVNSPRMGVCAYEG
jgi:hypothetical protein